MSLSIKVMLRGIEIDRIVNSARVEPFTHIVTYRHQLWRVVDDCISLDDRYLGHESHRREWAQLIERLLPKQLPGQIERCTALIESCFRDVLPKGVLQAVCYLVSLRLEQQARELLVDFLSQKHDSALLLGLLQPPFVESTESTKSMVSSASAYLDVSFDILTEEADWEWDELDEFGKPSVDDMALRHAAEKVQASIGSHRALESGDPTPGFDDMDDLSWTDKPAVVSAVESRLENERVLMERIGKLGPVALDLLRYFSNNSGDRAFHAQQVLGYSAAEINRLLSGSLALYLTRNTSGGWECHPWTTDVLEALNGASSSS